jgi:hypothetical protein
LFEMVSIGFLSIWSSLHHSSSAFAWSWQVCRIDEGRFSYLKAATIGTYPANKRSA